MRDLVSVPALPEASPAGRPGTIVSSLLARVAILSVHSRREASEQHDEGREEQDNHGRKNRPHAGTEHGVASASIAVDVALDDAEKNEIRYHDHEGNEPGHSSDHCCEDSAADSRAEREEERDECHAAGDRVEDHDTRECLRGIGSGCRESGLIDLAHDFRWVIANMLGVAEILIGSV